MVKIKNLTCRYGSKVILNNISLDIDKHLSVLGSNGSGKSTLARAICKLVEYDGGISIDGRDTKELSQIELAKLISYVPPKLDIYDPYIVVEEFVLLSRYTHKKSFMDYAQKDMKIVKSSLEMLHISHLKKEKISSLSSGETQLVLMAGALAAQSRVIILDEPTANLDPKNSKIIARHIKGLMDYHQIILITHDLHLASFIDSPTLFIKDTDALVYDEFYNDATLKELYGVEFDNLVVKYE